MAITTTNEKLALMAWMQPWQSPLPVSSDGLDQADSQQLLWGLPGPLWGAPPVVIRHFAVFGRLTVSPIVGVESVTLNEDV